MLKGGWQVAALWVSLFFSWTEFEIMIFALAKQELYHLSHTSSPFCSGYFGDGVS
jgi:hypothetical protein